MSTRSLLLIPLGLLLPACLADIDTSLIKEDGAVADQAVDQDGPRSDGPRPDGPKPDGPKPDGPRPDGPVPDSPGPDSPKPDQLPDTVPPPDSPVQDLPSGVCTQWSDWTCTTTPKTAKGSCSVSGTEIFSLNCNPTSCACARLGGNSKVCTTAGGTCATVQQAFNAGCCAGL